MPANAKPATSLPWHCNDNRLFAGMGDDSMHRIATIIAPSRTQNPDDATTDAAYIVTACNAYPQLVADRQELVAALRSITHGGNVDKGTHWLVDADDMTQARALLAKLGEA